MNNTEVLVLHGPPGSGKTTLADTIADLLRESEIANAVIDLDELSKVYPHVGRSFSRDNLKSIWPNYAAIPGIKVLLPTVISDKLDFEQLREYVPASRFMVCELIVPEEVAKNRVTAREPSAYWKERLRNWVDVYYQRTDLEEIRDFQVQTHDKPITEAAKEIMEKAGWMF